jgi:hypothetical protein
MTAPTLIQRLGRDSQAESGTSRPTPPTAARSGRDGTTGRPRAAVSPGSQEYCRRRKQRSGCGIRIVTRPSALVRPVMPSGERGGVSGCPAARSSPFDFDRLTRRTAGVDRSHRAKLDRSRSRIARRIAMVGARELFTLDPGEGWHEGGGPSRTLTCRRARGRSSGRRGRSAACRSASPHRQWPCG